MSDNSSPEESLLKLLSCCVHDFHVSLVDVLNVIQREVLHEDSRLAEQNAPIVLKSFKHCLEDPINNVSCQGRGSGAHTS